MEINAGDFIELTDRIFLKHYEKLPENFFTTEDDKRIQSIMLLNQLQAEACNGKVTEAIEHLVLMVENLMFYKMDDILRVAEAEASARIKKSINGRKAKGFKYSDRQKTLAHFEQAERQGISLDTASKTAKEKLGIQAGNVRKYKSEYKKGARAKKNR